MELGCGENICFRVYGAVLELQAIRMSEMVMSTDDELREKDATCKL